jgi:hypothetical protein
VHGIDLSEAMVARLKAKPGSDAIPATIGDFAAAKADGTFRSGKSRPLTGSATPGRRLPRRHRRPRRHGRIP